MKSKRGAKKAGKSSSSLDPRSTPVERRIDKYASDRVCFACGARTSGAGLISDDWRITVSGGFTRLACCDKCLATVEGK